MSDKQKRTITQLLAAVIIAMLTFTASLTATTFTDRQELERRLYSLEQEAKQERDLRYKSDIAKLALQHELSKSFQMIDVIQAYIDAMPFPAWIKKRLESGEFEMLVINRAYELAFDITKTQYQGRKDSEVWPNDIADNFRALDEKVFNSKRAECANETVMRDGERVDNLSCKFPLKISDEKFGVGGVIIK